MKINNTLRISDEMFLEMRHLCDDDFITSVTKGLNIVTSSENRLEVSNYFETSFSEARNLDKISGCNVLFGKRRKNPI